MSAITHVDDPLAGIGYTDDDLTGIVLNSQQRLFLDEYRKIGQFVSACQASGIPQRLVRSWCEDPEFEFLMDETWKLHCEEIVQEAYRRAVHGTPRYKFHKGEPVMWTNPVTGEWEHYYELEKSDRILVELLQVVDDRFASAKSAGGSNVTINNVNANSNVVGNTIGVIENPQFYGNNAHDLLEGE